MPFQPNLLTANGIAEKAENERASARPPASGDWLPILLAVRAISARCDGAVSEDGRGFNGGDTSRGKRLARMDRLTTAQARQAWSMLRKYSRQLEAERISWAELPVPPAGTSARLITCVTDQDGKAFRLSWPFRDKDTMLPAAGNFFPRKSYRRDPGPAHWRVPAEPLNAARLMEFALEFSFEVTEAAVAMFDAMISQAEPAELLPPAALAKATPRSFPDRILRHTSGGSDGSLHFVFHFEFRDEVYNAVKLLNGARYLPTPRAWAVPLAEAAAVAAVAQRFAFNIGMETKALIAQILDAALEAERIAKRRKAALLLGIADVEQSEFGGKKPRPYQMEGLRFLIEEESAINADDMGLGKTFVSSLWGRAYYKAFGAVVFVLSPKSVRGDWRAEAEACKTPMEIYTWAKIPPPPNKPFVMIADEAQNAQTLTSQRTKAFLALAESPNCLAVLPVSGTPMRGGRPKNIFPLLVAIKHPLALLGKTLQESKKEFEKRYCAARLVEMRKNGKVVKIWDNTGAAHLDELNKELRKKMLRRVKSDVLKDLPPKTRIIREIEISAEGKAQYSKAVNEAQAIYKQRLAISQAKEARGEELAKDDLKEGGEELVYLTHVRTAASIAKVPGAIEIADSFLDDPTRKVILFTEYEPAATALANHYRKQGIQTELLTGKVNEDERQAMKLRFQKGASRVWISTIKAGGVGLTLTAADTVILIDQAWMIDDVVQAEDRAHRIGQLCNVTAIWLRAFPVDEKIQKRLLQQEKVLKGVMAGSRATLRGMGVTAGQMMKEVARELFQEANAK